MQFIDGLPDCGFLGMSSLVSYEDSESEDESVDRVTLESSASVQTQGSPQHETHVPCRHSGPEQTLLEFNESVSEHQRRCFNRKWNRIAPDKQSTPQSLPVTLPQMPQRLSDGWNPSKRHHAVPAGVRPYIPKRQRQATPVETVDPQPPLEQVSGNKTQERQILSDASEAVKPYLGHKPGAAGIPRRLQMSLGGHQGPVNTVQWCPVPHLSHLLLSASMDKTFKVWDGAESGRCLRVYTCHSGAVRDACWTPCGRHLLTGSFDDTAAITDVETGQQIVKLDNQFKVMCAVLHPSHPDVFLCGGHSSAVKAWDSRSCKVVKVYKAGVQQTLDILFLRGAVDFIASSDCVSRDSADRTLIAWDYETTAKVSNQIYHERYTCPSLALHPLEDCFVAQTNGNYMAVFSSQQPYRMNKRRRYEGHKVEGYAVQCEFSRDGAVLASGSSTGSAHFYDYHSGHVLHTLRAHSQPCLCVCQHPVLPATAATCDWAGEVKVWH
ncbi:WD repeat-containing protein 25 [Betta splendens]|uniref:WD repeat-containing protein 25 n=1 Tax=Betta splendens TaxID=158456 RepID=A0A6P7LNB8_BETSP|nr:WD repeat-containing protein 25 [Betta splendens]